MSSIAPILAGQPTKHSYHHISATCHQLVLDPKYEKGMPIYKRIEQEMRTSIDLKVREWKGSIMSKENGWLARLVQGWRVWEERVVGLS